MEERRREESWVWRLISVSVKLLWFEGLQRITSEKWREIRRWWRWGWKKMEGFHCLKWSFTGYKSWMHSIWSNVGLFFFFSAVDLEPQNNLLDTVEVNNCSRKPSLLSHSLLQWYRWIVRQIMKLLYVEISPLRGEKKRREDVANTDTIFSHFQQN